ncbi:hypothetical protein MJN71_20820 [Salmonella enterica subsp. enterica serovar Cerro]|nr:hypothetical protein [Salmonella enterica subsp. enterica serovar Cerro]MEB8545724.1 hypothetical protein [Salmonella enterica subsp. enterica serovar Cerro]
MKGLKIWWHKRQAKKATLAFYRLTYMYQCGIDVINIVTGGEYNRLVNLRNSHMQWLRENDPNFPKKKHS